MQKLKFCSRFVFVRSCSRVSMHNVYYFNLFVKYAIPGYADGAQVHKTIWIKFAEYCTE